MQAPFWKADGQAHEALVADLDLVLASCAALGIEFVVIPLVDNGKIEMPRTGRGAAAHPARSRARRCRSRASRSSSSPICRRRNWRQFIARFPRDVFGINYDIGNSAALGFDCGEEIAAYAPRILNVHVKDRLRGGTTVPLGTGAAELAKAIRLIEQSGYSGQYILQTARAADGDHAGALARYRDMTVQWIEDAAR